MLDSKSVFDDHFFRLSLSPYKGRVSMNGLYCWVFVLWRIRAEVCARQLFAIFVTSPQHMIPFQGNDVPDLRHSGESPEAPLLALTARRAVGNVKPL